MDMYKSTTGPSHETFRVILFRYWGEATSAAPAVTVAEVLESVGPHGFLNNDNTGARGDRERRIEVHKSKFFTMNNLAKLDLAYKWNINVNGMKVRDKEHIKYRSTATEQPVSGGFYFLFISTNATGANKASFDVHTKLSFYDN